MGTDNVLLKQRRVREVSTWGLFQLSQKEKNRSSPGKQIDRGNFWKA